VPEFLTEEGVVRPGRCQLLPDQPLDRPVGFGDRTAVGLERCRDAGTEVGERELRRQVRGAEREPQITRQTGTQRAASTISRATAMCDR
jgi:hypothetical protein